jgi:hypothetical protein
MPLVQHIQFYYYFISLSIIPSSNRPLSSVEHESDALAGQYRSIVQSQRLKGKDSELQTNVAM